MKVLREMDHCPSPVVLGWGVVVVAVVVVAGVVAAAVVVESSSSLDLPIGWFW